LLNLVAQLNTLSPFHCQTHLQVVILSGRTRDETSSSEDYGPVTCGMDYIVDVRITDTDIKTYYSKDPVNGKRRSNISRLASRDIITSPCLWS
jgi:hypothetical protein